MAIYEEYLDALNKLNDVKFKKFIDNFKNFRLETRTQYAVFFAARARFYENQACQLLGLETEADRKKVQDEKRYEKKARKILKIRSVKEKDIDEYKDILEALTQSGDLAQQTIFRLKKSVTFLWIAFSSIVLYLIIEYLLKLL
ncbi:MAG: hypothetical protein ACUZ8O_11635 [Candidatus Anammoxibacter sp.]